MSKYVPPHRRKTLRLQDPAGTPNDLPSPITPSLHSASRKWHGERPTSSGASSAGGPPSALSLTSPSHAKLLQAYGDSFVGPLLQLDRVVDVHRFSGATAKGLANEQSQQQVGRRIVEHLDRTRPEKVLLQFGNVDIHISSVYQLEKTAPDAVAQWDPRAFVGDVLAAYEAFLTTHIFPRLERPPPNNNTTNNSSNNSSNKNNNTNTNTNTNNNHNGSSLPTTPDDNSPPAYIRHLYLCSATLPVVTDAALPESHAKYQFPKKRDGVGNVQPERSAREEDALQREAAERIERVRPLVPRCGMHVRREMTALFNERLREVAAAANRERGAPASLAEVHFVDLNQYIQEEGGLGEVAAPYVTADPTNLHLVWETTLPFWIKELDSAGLRTYDMPTQRELDEQAAKYAARKDGQMGQMVIMKQKRDST